jgi:uncharacterized membrane protein YqjE
MKRFEFEIASFKNEKNKRIVNFIVMVFCISFFIIIISKSIFVILFALLIILISGIYRLGKSISTYIYEIVLDDVIVIRYLKWGQKREIITENITTLRYDKKFSISKARIPYLDITCIDYSGSIEQFSIGAWNENIMDEVLDAFKSRATSTRKSQ